MIAILDFNERKMPNYSDAYSRPDLSKRILHLTKPNQEIGDAFEVLKRILGENRLLPSQQEPVTRYYSQGSVCLYDIPIRLLPITVETNPSNRSWYGISVHKGVFWREGGRPAIYTDVDSDSTDSRYPINYGSPPLYCNWPEKTRFRLINTNLANMGTSKLNDWTHEREWRYPGTLELDKVLYDTNVDLCWRAIVKTYDEAKQILRDFSNVPECYFFHLENEQLSPSILCRGDHAADFMIKGPHDE